MTIVLKNGQVIELDRENESKYRITFSLNKPDENDETERRSDKVIITDINGKTVTVKFVDIDFKKTNL